MIEHLRGQAAYRQQQAKRLTELSRSDVSRADALEDSLVLVLTRLQPQATRFSFSPEQLAALSAPLDRANVRQRGRAAGRSPTSV